ncbi:MAG: hypothetical protein OKBPIBMD_01767 [Chlorobi bacterium]|nr:hypothetical protein [Chlorobiota bacterium]
MRMLNVYPLVVRESTWDTVQTAKIEHQYETKAPCHKCPETGGSKLITFIIILAREQVIQKGKDVQHNT